MVASVPVRPQVVDYLRAHDTGEQSSVELAAACADEIGARYDTVLRYVQAIRAEAAVVSRAVERAEPACSQPPDAPRAVERQQGAVERAIYIPDPHVPDTDERAWASVLRLIEWWQPHKVFVLGDLWDAYSVSRYRKNPRQSHTLAEELHEVREWLWTLRRAVGDAPIVCCLGNHEARFQDYLWDRAPELASLDGMTAESLMGLRDVAAEFVPYNRGFLYRNLLVEHGDVISGKAGYTAHRLLERRMSAVICGHTHRLGHVWMRTHAGILPGVEAGCLQQMRPEYAKSKTNWMHGCAVSTWQDGDPHPMLMTVPIIDGVAHCAGRRF